MALIAAFGVTLSCSRTEPGFDLGPWTDAGAGAAGSPAGEGAEGGTFQGRDPTLSGGAVGDGGDSSAGGSSGGGGTGGNATGGTAPGGAPSAGGAAPGGAPSTGGAAPGGAPSTGGTSTGGASTTGGAGGFGAGGSGGLDCSVIGCSPPPFCDSGCTAPCGCCPCAEGSSLDPTTVCLGGCWATVADSGAPDGGSGACTTSADCSDPDYCSREGMCLSPGACSEPIDCDDPDNTYPHKGCPGYGACAGDTCVWQCGDARCRDVTGVSFGDCAAFLGFGILSGQCAAVSGCDPGDYTLSTSLSECQATCLRGNPNQR